MIHQPNFPAQVIMGTDKKIEKAVSIIRSLGSVVVAFSAGVDSTLVAKLAVDTLGANVLLVTLVSETFTRRELERSRKIAELLGADYQVVRTCELDNPLFAANPKDRCYHCKLERLGTLVEKCGSLGYGGVVDGSNTDDAGDFRPGAKAAKELGIVSPLAEAGFNKSEVREASHSLKLPTWDLPSDACLASRIPYGTGITADLLERIEKAEQAVREIAGCDVVRVRHHGDVARIEVDTSHIECLVSTSIRSRIIGALKELGYHYIALDLEGYSTGSMNRSITENNGKE